MWNHKRSWHMEVAVRKFPFVRTLKNLSVASSNRSRKKAHKWAGGYYYSYNNVWWL